MPGARPHSKLCGRLRLWGLGLVFLCAWGTVHATKGPEPASRISLGPLGYEPVQNRYLLAGGTMFTVHFVDNTHLLVTWSARGLLKRLVDSQPNDQDRNVDAALLELPTGRVLARTTWRLRDHATYLWPLGHGHFLLRLRNEFVALEPLENLAGGGDAFAQHKVLESQRIVGYVFLSPDSEVLTVESVAPKGVTALTDRVQTADQRPPVQINFYRVLSNQGKPVTLQYAGIVYADNPVSLPLTGEGYLEPIKDSPTSYNFDFVPFEGKRMELAAFDTTCFPRVTFVSRSEFVSFGCRGSDQKQQLGFFNLRGEHPWVAAFANQHVNPSIVSAPEAGRFVLGRTIVNSAALDLDNLAGAEVSGQEITAYQAEDGRALLKLAITPVQRAGQNFDIAPDGLSLAVIRDGTIEVYALPPLTGKDHRDLEAAAKLAPPEYKGLVRITGEEKRGAAEASAESMAQPLTPPPPPQSNNTVGDPVNDPEAAPRKPPSLYGPDDHPKP